jgi:hypothetical protein
MVIIAPGITLVLFTVPYFMAVIAAVIYTNKKITKGHYDKIAMKVNNKKPLLPNYLKNSASVYKSNVSPTPFTLLSGERGGTI